MKRKKRSGAEPSGAERSEAEPSGAERSGAEPSGAERSLPAYQPIALRANPRLFVHPRQEFVTFPCSLCSYAMRSKEPLASLRRFGLRASASGL